MTAYPHTAADPAHVTPEQQRARYALRCWARDHVGAEAVPAHGGPWQGPLTDMGARYSVRRKEC